MSNHEFNALCWAQPNDDGSFLRSYPRENLEQHEEFLRQISEGSDPHAKALDWFKPFRYGWRFPGLRVVHACWNGQAQEILRTHLNEGYRFTKAGLRAASCKGTKAYDAAEILLKGPEARLPGDRTFEDKQGTTRRDMRLRGWDPDATTIPPRPRAAWMGWKPGCRTCR
jgi:hypothetical protein